MDHVYAQIVNGSPDFRGQPASVLLASDDAEAKEAVAALARDAGYDPGDDGPLWSAFNVEKVAAVMITIAYVVDYYSARIVGAAAAEGHGAPHDRSHARALRVPRAARTYSSRT